MNLTDFKNRTVLVPKNMGTMEESFRELGFVFEDIHDEVLCSASFPLGWNLYSEGAGWAALVDSDKNIRGHSYYCGLPSHREGKFFLTTRYMVVNLNIEQGENDITVIVKDNKEGLTLFTAGNCDENSSEYKEIRKKAYDFLDRNFPEWKDPTKYWN